MAELWTNFIGSIFQYPEPYSHGQGDWRWSVGAGYSQLRFTGKKRLPKNWVQHPR